MRGAGQHKIAGVQTLEPRKRLQGLHGRVDDVAVDEHVLADLPVHPQTQPQVREALQLIGVQQRQRGADRSERRIRLCR